MAKLVIESSFHWKVYDFSPKYTHSLGKALKEKFWDLSKKSGKGFAGAIAYQLVILSPAASAGCPQWGWERPPSSVSELCVCFHAA